MANSDKAHLNITFLENDLAVADVANAAWIGTDAITIEKYWSGKRSPNKRHFTTCLLWSPSALYVRFDAARAEPLVVSDRPDVTTKAIGLWDRDVCEIFIAPDVNEPRRYFEFEVAPTGEWLDVALDLTSGERISHWEYSSGMETFAEIGPDCVVMTMKIPWEAFGGLGPSTGDVWLGNLFRCAGEGAGRGYLAWQPTLTTEPAFHVPEKFGEFRFVE